MQKIDVADPTWREIKGYVEKRLVMWRGVLETKGMSPEDTEGARYAIDELKALLNLPNPSKIPSTSSEKTE